MLFSSLRLIIFGAGGALGLSLSSEAPKLNMTIRMIHRDEVSEADFEKLYETYKNFNDVAVVNCMALTRIDDCQKNPSAAFAINTLLAKKIEFFASRIQARYIYISTENVFSCNVFGKKFRESDSCNPATIYGLSKLLGEPNISCLNSLNLRLPLMYGEFNKSQVVGSLVTKILAGVPINVVDDVFSTPVYSKEVARFILNEVVEKNYSGVVHLCSESYLSLYEMIMLVATELDLEKFVRRISLNKLSPAAIKPRFGGLESLKFKPLSSFEDNFQTHGLKIFGK